MTTNARMKADEAREISAFRSASLSADEVPRRILLAPWGHVESTSGSFIVDDESAQLVVHSFEEHATDLPIDYEHQSLGGAYSSPNGQAPAAGWVKRIFGDVGVGLLAEIEWTDQAAEMLASKQYRYLSPVAIIRKTDRKLVAIHSAALTNKPAIVGMEPIVNRLDAGADLMEESSFEKLRAQLELPLDTDAGEVLVAAGKKLAQLRRDAGRRHVEERVREAVRAGKLVEAQRAWAEALVACEEELFDEWFRTAPVIVTPGKLATPCGVDSQQARRRSMEMRARAEFRASGVLAGLTTEDAYVADALRHVLN